MESSLLIVIPVHLVGLTLSGEVGQGCCNCCKTRNELAIVANKVQEGPDVSLRYRSGELPSSLHFAGIWLDGSLTDDVPKIGTWIPPKWHLQSFKVSPAA